MPIHEIPSNDNQQDGDGDRTRNVLSGQLFADLPPAGADERFDELARGRFVRIERIVSQGQASPENFWYDQDQDEWVMVVKGGAALQLEGRDELLEMGPGDHVLIPAHCKHRVARTSSSEPTIWLAVHFFADDALDR